jgi:membrane protein YqaA with SNARE-associated domain
MIFALAALFMWSFLAATILPLGSEAPLVVYVRSYGQVAVPVLVATAGNYLGACTTYWLGRRAAQALGGGRGAAEPPDTRSAKLLRRFGPPALLLSWVPILGDALVALAGAVRMPFGAFSLWAAAGKALRYAAVAWAAAAVWREAG